MTTSSELEVCLIESGLISIKKQTKFFLIPFVGWLLIILASFYNLIKIKYKYWRLIVVYCIVLIIGAPTPTIMFFKYFGDMFKVFLYFGLPFFVIGISLCIYSFFYQKKRLIEFFLNRENNNKI